MAGNFLTVNYLVRLTVIIRINAAAFIKCLALKVGRSFEGGVYSREAFIANLVTTTVNLLCHLNVNLTNTINPKNTKNKSYVFSIYMIIYEN